MGTGPLNSLKQYIKKYRICRDSDARFLQEPGFSLRNLVIDQEPTFFHVSVAQGIYIYI